MSRKQKFKPAVAVANRADDPYITSGAGSVQSDKFWRWGDDNLFPNAESPIGKLIRFNKIPLKVIGTLTPKGYNSMGMDQDDMVLAPYTTVQKRILAITYL